MTALRPAVVSMLVAGAAALGACGGSERESDGIFDREQFPFTFEYPDGFEEEDEVSIDVELGAEPVATAAVTSAENNAVLVQLFKLNFPVGKSNLRLAEREFDRLLGYLDPEASFRETTVAGLPALETGVLDVPSIESAESRLTVVFDGDREYFFNCQWTEDGRADVEKACGMALGTLELE